MTTDELEVIKRGIESVEELKRRCEDINLPQTYYTKIPGGFEVGIKPTNIKVRKNFFDVLESGYDICSSLTTVMLLLAFRK